MKEKEIKCKSCGSSDVKLIETIEDNRDQDIIFVNDPLFTTETIYKCNACGKSNSFYSIATPRISEYTGSVTFDFSDGIDLGADNDKY